VIDADCKSGGHGKNDKETEALTNIKKILMNIDLISETVGSKKQDYDKISE